MDRSSESRFPDLGAVIKACWKVFSRFGIPRELRTDNGGCYDSKEFWKFAETNGMRLVTSSPRYPQSIGMAERAVKVVKGLWRKANDRDSSIFAYRTTPLKSRYSPSKLMFGRPIRSTLRVPYFVDMDYNDFEDKDMSNHDVVKSKWDTKYRARPLPKLEPGDQVWVKFPTDKGCNGTVLKEDPSPNSFWVNMGSSEVRRNRKHLFLLHDTQTEDIFYDCQDDFSPLQEETELENDEQPAEIV